MKVVLETDVLIAGLRSPSGASAELLRLARRSRFTLLVSVPLFIEYEAQCTVADHMAEAGLVQKDVDDFLDALAAIAQPVAIHYSWRPQLRDPADEMVLETAVNGVAQILVTFNRRDFGTAPGRFGIEMLLPSEALRRLR